MTTHTVSTGSKDNHFLRLRTGTHPFYSFGDYLVIQCSAPKFFFDRHPPLRPPPVQFNVRADARHGTYIRALWTRNI